MDPRSSPSRLFAARPQLQPKDRELKRAGISEGKKIPHNQSGSLFILKLQPSPGAHPLTSEHPPPAAAPPTPAGESQSRRSSPPPRPQGPAPAVMPPRVPSHAAAEATGPQRSGVCQHWLGSLQRRAFPPGCTCRGLFVQSCVCPFTCVLPVNSHPTRYTVSINIIMS